MPFYQPAYSPSGVNSARKVPRSRKIRVLLAILLRSLEPGREDSDLECDLPVRDTASAGMALLDRDTGKSGAHWLAGMLALDMEASGLSSGQIVLLALEIERWELVDGQAGQCVLVAGVLSSLRIFQIPEPCGPCDTYHIWCLLGQAPSYRRWWAGRSCLGTFGQLWFVRQHCIALRAP